MTSESTELRKEIEGFKRSSANLSNKINGVGDIWKDQNYAALRTQMGALAQSSKAVIENGEKTCSSIDKFFSVVAEDIWSEDRMPEVIVSREALTKVKTALRDYQVDISDFTTKAERWSSDVSRSAELEMKKIDSQITDISNEIRRLNTEIKRLEEMISQMTDEKKSAERLLKEKKNEAEDLKRKLDALWRAQTEFDRNSEVASGGPTPLALAGHAFMHGVTNPSGFARGVELGIDIVQSGRGRDGIPPGADGTVGPLVEGMAQAGTVLTRGVAEAAYRQHHLDSPLANLGNEQRQQIINELQRRLDQVEMEIRNLQSKISELERKIEEARKEKKERENELGTAKKHLNKLQDKQEKMKSTLSKLNENMNAMLTAAKSFETRAVSDTEKSLGGIDKCIAAIDGYLA